jgi:branched-chain amino acid transport system permease protein
VSAASEPRTAERSRPLSRAWLLDVVEQNRPPGLVGYPVLAAILLLLAGVLDPVNVRLVDTMLIYGIAAIGLNVTLGYCGLVSVAQAGFFGIGAYAWMLLSDRAHWNSLFALVAATLVCAAVGLVVGGLATRIRTHYFLIVTIGLQVTFATLAVNQTGLTGGSQGVAVDSVMHVGGWQATTPEALMRVIAVVFVVALYVGNRLRRSRQGRGMVALLQSSEAAEASGVNAPRYRAIGMAIGAAYGGLAGSLFAPYLAYLGPDSFGLSLSIELIVMLVIGGIGSNAGAVVGVVVLTEISHSSQSTLGLSNLIFGLALMILIIVAPGGIVGVAQSGLRWLLGGGHRGPRSRGQPPDAGLPVSGEEPLPIETGGPSR